jgi:hypothetical protein
MMERLCPRCGAYWKCGCVLDEWAQPPAPDCPHDWIETVGVEVDDAQDGAIVLLCRLCGRYDLAQRER